MKILKKQKESIRMLSKTQGIKNKYGDVLFNKCFIVHE